MDKAGKILKEKIKTLLHLGRKVYRYRKDVLPAETLAKLKTSIGKLEESLDAWLKLGDEAAQKQRRPELEKLHDELKDFLTKIGCKIYPLNFWNENIEVILVAAILAIGIRAFFFQPFRIPTGSMFPSFSGMRPQVYREHQKSPSFLYRTFNWFKEGAHFYEMIAPGNGNLKIPLFSADDPLAKMGRIRFKIVYGREIFGLWLPFLLPKPYRLYSLRIGDRDVYIKMPFEFFGFEEAIVAAFFPQFATFDELLGTSRDSIYYDEKHFWLYTNFYFKERKPVLRFELLAGDMLFVNRLAYHFRWPKVGESVIFRTENIQKLGEQKYYIKRLIGLPGDEIKLANGRLYRNGKIVEGSPAFAMNNERKGRYPGYRASGNLSNGQTITVPPNSFYVLGDNSPNSYDSRYWGFVPCKEVIGKAAFVLHPFSWRWGCAK